MKVVINIYKDGQQSVYEKLKLRIVDDTSIPTTIDDIEEFLTQQYWEIEEEAYE